MKDNRPRDKEGKLQKACEVCRIAPDKCKGFCVFQKMAEQTEREEKWHGNRLQRHGRTE